MANPENVDISSGLPQEMNSSNQQRRENDMMVNSFFDEQNR